MPVVAIPGVSFQSRLLHVGQPASCASSRSLYFPAQPGLISITPPSPSPDDGVRHPVQPLPDVRRTDAVCAQYNRPAGVAFIFQVCRYSIEPTVSNRALNLLTKDRVRAALPDEPEEIRPQVPFVLLAFPFAGNRERLAGTRTCPNRSSSGPSGKLKRVCPSPDPREEMHSPVSGKLASPDFHD
jgi:hypothetical protein